MANLSGRTDPIESIRFEIPDLDSFSLENVTLYRCIALWRFKSIMVAAFWLFARENNADGIQLNFMPGDIYPSYPNLDDLRKELNGERERICGRGFVREDLFERTTYKTAEDDHNCTCTEF